MFPRTTFKYYENYKIIRLIIITQCLVPCQPAATAGVVLEKSVLKGWEKKTKLFSILHEYHLGEWKISIPANLHTILFPAQTLINYR